MKKRDFLTVAITAVLASAAQAAPVAVVTDVQGKVVNAQPPVKQMSLLSEIEGDVRVQVEDKSRLVAVYYSTGKEFTIKGPSVVQFKADGPQAISGQAPETRAALAAADGKEVRLKPGGLARAAYMMMGAPAQLKLLALTDTRTLETKPEFRWSTIEGAASYDVKIGTDNGATVFMTSTTGTSVSLPAEVSLKPGARYTWRVGARLKDGTNTTSVGEFSVASSELQAQAEATRPAQSAAISQQVAYAIWLEQLELRDEARKYWEVARAQYPEDQRLEALANREQ